MEILKLYLTGCSYDEAAKITGISKGSVVNIITEFKKGKYPNLIKIPDMADELRNLSKDLKKSRLSLVEASLGLAFYRKIQGITDPQILDEYITMSETIAPKNFPIQKFINGAIELVQLQDKMGKPFDQALTDLEKQLNDKNSTLQKSSKQITQYEEQKKILNQELGKLKKKTINQKTTLSKMIKGTKNLRNLGPQKISDLATFAKECEDIGYNTTEIQELMILKNRKDTLQQQVITQERRLETLTKDAEEKTRNIETAMAEYRWLTQTADMLKKSKTSTTCHTCGNPLPILIPSQTELREAIKIRWIYRIVCQHCGKANQISPQKILMEIGWKTLSKYPS